LIFSGFYYSGIGGGLELFLLMRSVSDPLSPALSRRERGLLRWQDNLPLSLRDAYRDVGGRATQEAKAERAREREYILGFFPTRL